MIVLSFLNESWQLFLDYDFLYYRGIINTLYLSLVGTIAGLFFGFILASFRQITINENDSIIVKVLKYLLKILTSFYIEFVRGTPMVAQSVFLYYGLRSIFQWTPLTAGLIIVTFNTAAYMSEIIRSGIQSIPFGQTEASLALGMTKIQSFVSIILPQAIRNAFPSIGNEFVVNIKDTSMLNAIMVTELYFQGMSVAGATYNYSASMFVIMIIYFIMTFIVTNILRLIENRLRLNSQEVSV